MPLIGQHPSRLSLNLDGRGKKKKKKRMLVLRGRRAGGAELYRKQCMKPLGEAEMASGQGVGGACWRRILMVSVCLSTSINLPW